MYRKRSAIFKNKSLFTRTSSLIIIIIIDYNYSRMLGSFTCLIAVSNCTTDTDTVDLKEDEDPK